MADPPILTPEQIAANTAAINAQTTATVSAGQAAEITASKTSAYAEALNKVRDGSIAAAKSSGTMMTATQMAGNVLDFFKRIMSETGTNIKNMGDLSQEGTEKLAFFANGAINARVAFEGLSGVDTTGLVTIKSQMDYLNNALLAGGTAGDIAKSSLLNMAKGVGMSETTFNKIWAKGPEAVQNFAKSLITGTDNVFKLQNAMYQLTAQSGKLGSVDFGTNMHNMNALFTEQAAAIAEAGTQTGLGLEQLEQYWAQLGQVPGALQKMTIDLGGATGAVNILTATIDLAKQSGLTQKEITEDMAKAMNSYGHSMADAFKYSARIGEVSDKLGLPLKDVRTALLSSSEAFKMFAGSGEEAAKQSISIGRIMENYGGALQKAGVSSSNTAALVTQMTNSMSGLRIEQLAFLSQQTGGPGGLMGGYRIQKMLREDPEAAMDLVKKQMIKQMGGKLTSFESALQSEGSANQYMKQQQILMNGPTAQFAKTKEEADAILKSFIGGGRTDLKEIGLDKQLAGGKDVENLSRNPLTDLKSTLQGLEYTVNIANFDKMQREFGAAPGMPVQDSVEMTEFRNNQKLRKSPHIGPTSIGHMAAGNIQQGASAISNIGGLIKSHLPNTESQAIKMENNKQVESLQKKLEESKKQYPKLTGDAKIKAWNDNLNKQNKLDQMAESSVKEEYQSAGAQVGNAAQAAPATVKSSNAEVVAQGGTVETPNNKAGNDKDINIVVSGEFVLKDTNGNILSDNAKSVSAAVK